MSCVENKSELHLLFQAKKSHIWHDSSSLSSTWNCLLSLGDDCCNNKSLRSGCLRHDLTDSQLLRYIHIIWSVIQWWLAISWHDVLDIASGFCPLFGVKDQAALWFLSSHQWPSALSTKTNVTVISIHYAHLYNVMAKYGFPIESWTHEAECPMVSLKELQCKLKGLTGYADLNQEGQPWSVFTLNQNTIQRSKQPWKAFLWYS